MSSAPAACAAAAMALIPLEWNGLTYVMRVRDLILGYVTKVHYACMYMYQLKHARFYIRICNQGTLCVYVHVPTQTCMYVYIYTYAHTYKH